MSLLPVSGRVRALACLFISVLVAAPANVLAQEDDILVAIAKFASPTVDGAVIIRIHIACDPLPGTEDFQEGFSGANQRRSGADGESGIDGMIVCDGQARTHTARIYPHDGAFVRGPASASASAFICNLVGEQQLCIAGAASRRIIIRGRLMP